MQHTRNIQDSCGGQGCTVKKYSLPREEYVMVGKPGRKAPTPSHQIKTRIAKNPAHPEVKYRVQEAA